MNMMSPKSNLGFDACETFTKRLVREGCFSWQRYGKDGWALVFDDSASTGPRNRIIATIRAKTCKPVPGKPESMTYSAKIWRTQRLGIPNPTARRSTVENAKLWVMDSLITCYGHQLVMNIRSKPHQWHRATDAPRLPITLKALAGVA